MFQNLHYILLCVFLREFVREVKKNDGSTQDFEESNFAMTRRNEEAKGEVVCKGVEESDQKADNSNSINDSNYFEILKVIK